MVVAAVMVEEVLFNPFRGCGHLKFQNPMVLSRKFAIFKVPNVNAITQKYRFCLVLDLKLKLIWSKPEMIT